MNTSYKTRIARRLCLATVGLATLVLSVAPYAAQALEILQPERDEKKPANDADPTAETRVVEANMTRYDVAALDMTRFHTHPKQLPHDTAILQHAFNIGIQSAGKCRPSHVSRVLLDNGGPTGNMVARVDATTRQLALLEVLRHDITAQGESLASFDEAVLVAIRRGLEHIRHFGMPNLDDVAGVMHVPMPAAPLPYLG